MWVNYKYLDNSLLGQYFKAGCDVIAVTMATLKFHKKNPPTRTLHFLYGNFTFFELKHSS